ncbi:MAG TPA: type II toxin-antitoxin system prevent-host-death family antitoxin [Polyangia bacterium]|jgi:prevent-host-death family protein
MTCSVSKAKARLSELIRSAQQRHEVIITDHGRPVARLIAYELQQESLDERFLALRERGILVPASGSTKDPWPPATRVPGALERFLGERNEP